MFAPGRSAGEDGVGVDQKLAGDGDAAQRLDVRTESGRLAKPRKMAKEGQVAGLKGRLETLKEEAAVETREDADGQEEARAAGREASVRPEATSWHDAEDVRVIGSVCPHVCRIAIIPVSAPQMLGSAPMVRSSRPRR